MRQPKSAAELFSTLGQNKKRRQQGDCLDIQNDAAELKIRAEVTLGKMLEEITVKGGERHKLHHVTYERLATLPKEISRIQSHHWQLEASVPKRERETYIGEVREARQQQPGEEAINHAHSIKIYALRKLGEILNATKRNRGAEGIGKSVVLKENHTLTLAELGIDIKTSHIAQKLAELPQKQFEQVITEVFY